MEVHYSNLKLGYDDLCDACDDIVAFANSSSSKLRDVIIYASKKDPHSSCVLENVKTNLINMLNEIYSQLLGPTKKILDMMTEDLEENTGFSESTAFDFDYENNFIIKMTKLIKGILKMMHSNIFKINIQLLNRLVKKLKRIIYIQINLVKLIII